MYSQLRSDCISSTYEQYDNNNKVQLFTQPIPIKSLPADTNILRFVLTFKIKDTDITNTYNLTSRLCANGSTQVQGEDYQTSYSPVSDGNYIRIIIAIAFYCRYIVRIIDIYNACQNTHCKKIQLVWM